MLNIDSKDVLDICQELGYEVKNQLSGLDPDQREAIEVRVKRGQGGGTATLERPKAAAQPLIGPEKKVKVLDARPRPVVPARPAPVPPPAAPPAAPTPVVERPAPAAVPPSTPPPVVQTPPTVQPAPTAPAAKPPAAPAGARPTPPAPPTPTIKPAVPPTAVPTPSKVPAPPSAPGVTAPAAKLPPQAPPRAPEPRLGPADGGPKPPPTSAPPARPRDLNQPRPDAGQRRQRPPMRPGFVISAKPPPPLKAQQPKAEEKKQPAAQPKVQQPVARLPEGFVQGKGPINIKDILNRPVTPTAPVVEDEDEEGNKDKKKKAPTGVVGRDQRHQERAKRQAERKGRENEKRSLLPGDEQEDARSRAERLKRRLKEKQRKGTLPPKSARVVVTVPITIRSLSESMGVRSAELLFKLRDHGINAANLNLTVEPDMAEMLAMDFGRELEIKRPLDAEAQLLVEKVPDRPEDLVPRAPVVTIMGHVDHGKTSLLDKIRQSDVAATEAGGITQVIRAWRVDHGGRPITFLDTPGHEAFTKMRARGAHVTDIAVIVVAADDGVMPQTEEAINHARAAGVSLVVAINKVDLPNANLNKTRQQLYSLSVLPDNMGGDTPFVETSAATGKGIDELLDTLSLVAELKELKANPNKPAEGTCLEANLDPQEGVQATLLVQNGTLQAGAIVLCGATYGRVRAMYDDLGRPITAAGPSVPVRITGLDTVPNADDTFQVVPDLVVAREIAEKREEKQHEAATVKRTPLSLDSLAELKVTELKVILKADFRGSVEAIRKELEKLHHEEVRVRVLHTGIGAITESDVQLALTSPGDTIVVGFNVVPDDRALAMAEERGIKLREYNIIYKLTDDVRAALEGKLKPREEVIHLGRAVVRETFKISRVGTIAGCYVTQGTLERAAKVRVIREGAVIYPPPDKTASLESLKRFKEDVREVQQGYECGLKVAGYDDVKVGDVIEAYRIEQVQRTLDK
jgi:translation initiation factor IF-2